MGFEFKIQGFCFLGFFLEIVISYLLYVSLIHAYFSHSCKSFSFSRGEEWHSATSQSMKKGDIRPSSFLGGSIVKVEWKTVEDLDQQTSFGICVLPCALG